MLECKNLVKRFGSRTAVDNVSLTLAPGHIYAMLGPNGSGKTTWMKMVAGLIKPTAGTITFEGSPINVKTREDIAYMSTEPYFYNWMSVRSVGKYYQDFFKDFSMERYQRLLERMDLKEDLKTKALSTGMMAKLKIAVTMARASKVILLDEPLNGIDLIAREEIIRIIKEASSPSLILVLSSHLVEELENVSDQAIFLKNSHLVASYDIAALHASEGKTIVDRYREIYGREGGEY